MLGGRRGPGKQLHLAKKRKLHKKVICDCVHGWGFGVQLTAIDSAEIARKGAEVAGELLKTNNDCEHFDRCGEQKRASRVLSHRVKRALDPYLWLQRVQGSRPHGRYWCARMMRLDFILALAATTATVE
jgi:hypothetical protein